VTNRVGILGYQGCISPHITLLSTLGVQPTIVASREQLEDVERLIIPGGESTTMLKFIETQGLASSLIEFGKSRPVWGICAGAIIIARDVQSPAQKSLGLIDIRATRNFYGSQLDSFTRSIKMQILDGKELACHFIRAPLLTAHESSSTAQNKLHVLAAVDEQPVFFAQGNVWACSFHVELGTDPSLHEAFLAIR
jgi:pyridoxal 5'-phosphate synthase pdxT subunit